VLQSFKHSDQEDEGSCGRCRGADRAENECRWPFRELITYALQPVRRSLGSTPTEPPRSNPAASVSTQAVRCDKRTAHTSPGKIGAHMSAP
jgi:hypothetical protein